MDHRADVPNFFKVVTGQLNLIDGYEKAELTEVEKLIIKEQFDKWLEKEGVTLDEADFQAAIRIFCTGYLCGMLWGCSAVRASYHLDKKSN